MEELVQSNSLKYACLTRTDKYIFIGDLMGCLRLFSYGECVFMHYYILFTVMWRIIHKIIIIHMLAKFYEVLYLKHAILLYM